MSHSSDASSPDQSIDYDDANSPRAEDVQKQRMCQADRAAFVVQGLQQRRWEYAERLLCN